MARGSGAGGSAAALGTARPRRGVRRAAHVAARAAMASAGRAGPAPSRAARGGGTARLGRRAQAGPSRRQRPDPAPQAAGLSRRPDPRGHPPTPGARCLERPARPRPRALRPASPSASAERAAWDPQRSGAEREPRQTPTFWGLRPFWEDPRSPRPEWASCGADEPPRPLHPHPRRISCSGPAAPAAPRCVGSHDSSLSLNFASLASNVHIKLSNLF